MSKQNFMEKMLEGVEVEWKTLGDVGNICMCKRILKHQTTEIGDIPFYKIGTFGKEADAYITLELFKEYKAKYSYPKIGEILISASGTIGRAVIFDGKDGDIQTKIKKNRERLAKHNDIETIQNLSAYSIKENFKYSYHSIHKRNNNLNKIDIYHLFFDYT
ncbi:MAG: restriction endonuclease subunit S [Chitinispirillaceae bacterium]|nr:restriction endonuclease subunit S [Chitinispirillaceae bacterium]